MRELAGDDGALLLGVDLVKSPDVLIPAYDDPEGVTAAFNFNLLTRINREAGADFNLPSWRHEARWNEADARMESYLVSTADQTVHVAAATASPSPPATPSGPSPATSTPATPSPPSPRASPPPITGPTPAAGSK